MSRRPVAAGGERAADRFSAARLQQTIHQKRWRTRGMNDRDWPQQLRCHFAAIHRAIMSLKALEVFRPDRENAAARKRKTSRRLMPKSCPGVFLESSGIVLGIAAGVSARGRGGEPAPAESAAPEGILGAPRKPRAASQRRQRAANGRSALVDFSAIDWGISSIFAASKTNRKPDRPVQVRQHGRARPSKRGQP